MTKFFRFIRYWLPPLAWMALIFYLSSRLRVSVTGKFLFDFLIFKILHMIEYAILYFLLFRAFYSLNNPSTSLRTSQQLINNNKFIYPLIFSILYALSDEFHQTLVPTREGKIRDVLIDTAGIIIMYIYIKYYFKSIKKFL